MTSSIINRYSAALPTAAAVTAVLLYAMQALIATGNDPFSPDIELTLPTIVRVPPPQVPPIRKRIPPIDRPAPTPPQPTIDTRVVDGIVGVAVPMPPAPSPQPKFRTTGNGAAVPIPLVKVAAVYPQRAISRGVTGYVIVEYTITRTGDVTDIVVVESTHPIFEANAVAAAKKFRYRPRFVGGQPVETAGVLNRFTFELEN